MKLRFTMRSALLAILFLSLALGWYAKSASQRKSELRALARMDDLVLQVVISDGAEEFNHHDEFCSYNGALISVEDSGPTFLRRFSIDAFKRVKRIKIQSETNCLIFPLLAKFKELDVVTFAGVDTMASSDIDFLTAVERYCTDNPQVVVEKLYYGLGEVGSATPENFN